MKRGGWERAEERVASPPQPGGQPGEGADNGHTECETDVQTRLNFFTS